VARAVNLAGENFDTINRVVQRLADLNIFIASASEQQARMAADVAEEIAALNEISVQTSRNTAASAEAAVKPAPAYRTTERLGGDSQGQLGE